MTDGSDDDVRRAFEEFEDPVPARPNDTAPLRAITQAIEDARAAGIADHVIRVAVLANFPGNLTIHLEGDEDDGDY